MGYELDQDLRRDAIIQRRDGEERFFGSAPRWLQAGALSAPPWTARGISSPKDQTPAQAVIARHEQQG